MTSRGRKKKTVKNRKNKPAVCWADSPARSLALKDPARWRKWRVTQAVAKHKDGEWTGGGRGLTSTRANEEVI